MSNDRGEPPVPCLVGPTGSGKSDVGIAIARRLHAEVVCCDALTVYRGLSILTAKPIAPPDVPHHLLDVVEPDETYSAARFVEDADRLVEAIRARGGVPLIVGGTALYLKAFGKGLGPRVARDPDLRRRLEALAAERGPAALHERLEAVDPARAAEVHANDIRRLVRALEIVEATGGMASALRREWNAPDRRPIAVVYLRRTAADLERRLVARVLAMARAGVVEEVRALLARERPLSPEAASAIGFDDLREHLEGRLPLEACLERIVRATRRFTKRQATFFRQFRDATILDLGAEQSTEEVADAALLAFARLGVVPAVRGG